MSESLVLLGIVIHAVSGVIGLAYRRDSGGGQRISILLSIAASTLGLAGIAVYWESGMSEPIEAPWPIPGFEFSVAMDGLSAIFLAPVFLVSMLGAIYGWSYWKQPEHPENARKLRLFYGLLTASMGLLLIARNSILFLMAWEIMALSAFLLVTTEDEKRDVRDAGWLYFIATHTSTLCLFALFGVMRAATGSFAIAPLGNGLSSGMEAAVFVLALIGFGLKAGLMPLHVWLPSSHAMAPSHVSAIMSGVIIKMGIYGLVRVTSLAPQPPVAWGSIILALGVISGVFGVVFAISQHDLKRLLAYHSIENIGIILMGLGLALLGRSLGRPEWVVLGMAGCLLHVWNHALFKALLFLSAGSVIHAAHTRDIDRLGGLAKRMPLTALCFLAGSVAICGLPPLNGFVSEFLIYLGLFGAMTGDAGSSFAAAAFGAPALALIGALAVACFVKVYGTVFLGTARSADAAQVHEAPATMIVPMVVLVACCCLIGLAPVLIAPVIAQGISAWATDLPGAGARLASLAPLAWITWMSLLLVAALLLGGLWYWRRLHRNGVEYAATWGCGYAAPTARMQYTSSSFARMIVGMFAWVLRPRIHEPAPMPLFPGKSKFHSDVPDTLLDKAVLPLFRAGGWLFSRFRKLQHGSVQTYLLYIYVALIVLLLWR